MKQRTRELTHLLPYTFRDKFRYYLDFVNDRLYDIAVVEGKKELIPIINERVEFLFLLRMLYGYYVIGYENYKNFLNYFMEMQVDGFKIGTTDFTRDSEITQEWGLIAREFTSIIEEYALSDYVRPTMATDELIRKILTSHSEDQGA